MTQPSLTDLREITRYPKKKVTHVNLQVAWDKKIEWLILGETRLRQISSQGSPDGRWLLEAHLPAGVTDFEHDSGYALRLPLVGVTFQSIEYHTSNFFAWIDPDGVDSFNKFSVPDPGYNPMEHAEAIICKHCKPSHVIIPQGYYVPPHNQALYDIVRGKKVEIGVGAL